jgi:AcrR family transcriptional regulator
MGRRELKKADKHARIVEAAWELFCSRGFVATTTRDVCEAAGIGIGTLFSYVDDKTELLLLVFAERMQGRVDEAWAVLPEGGVLDQLVFVYGRLFDFYAEHRELGSHILRAAILPEGGGRERLEALQLPFQMQVAALLDAAIVRGELREDLPTPLAAATLFGTYVGALSAFLSGFVPDRESLDELFRAAVSLQIEGMRRH